MSQDILAVIPARSGSKGLPDKNIRELHDKPLIAWTILQVAASEHIDQFVLSTDSEEYADIARSYDAPVPFRRPPEYATDDAPSSDVLLHALSYYRDRGREFDVIAKIEPTSPLRKPGDLDAAIETFLDDETATALTSVGEVHLEHPYITKELRNGRVDPLIDHDKDIYQRQQLPEAYFPYGVIYLSEVETYTESESFYQDDLAAYEIERWQNYEIDDIYDFICIERILEHKGPDVEGWDE